jgi:hypothetical protein
MRFLEATDLLFATANCAFLAAMSPAPGFFEMYSERVVTCLFAASHSFFSIS